MEREEQEVEEDENEWISEPESGFSSPWYSFPHGGNLLKKISFRCVLLINISIIWELQLGNGENMAIFLCRVIIIKIIIFIMIIIWYFFIFTIQAARFQYMLRCRMSMASLYRSNFIHLLYSLRTWDLNSH
jgi:hypothetical protein